MNLRKFICLLSGLALTFSVAACRDHAAKQETETKAPVAQTQVETPTDETQNQPQFPFTGKVAETMNGGGYTYILLEKGDQKTWAATLETPVKVGEDITLPSGTMMLNFHSKTLNRDFDKIIFASGIAGKTPVGSSATPPAATGAHSDAASGSFAEALKEGANTMDQQQFDPSSAAMGSGKAVVPFAKLKIDKAEDGYTVAELFNKAKNLNGKKIKVKGQVMKVSMRIMGKNWIHIQDGTGDPKSNTHDLVVTSQATPKKGDIVTIEGTLSADKDFGAGYRYAVIIEDAGVK